MKKLYLHVGMTKTGSTSLQFFLRDNKEQLKKDGFLFPSDKETNHYSMLINSEYRDKIIAEINVSETNNIILSHEVWYNLEDKKVEALVNYLKDKFDLHIIIYLRRQDTWVESIYCQYVLQYEHKFTGTLKQFISSKYNYSNYLKILEKWEKIISKDNIHVISFDKAKTQDNGVFIAFLNQIGIKDTQSYTFIKKQHNPTAGHIVTEFIRELNNNVNPNEMKPDNYRELIYNLKYSYQDEEPLSFFQNKEKKKYIKKYFKSNQKIEQKYLQGEILFTDKIKNTNFYRQDNLTTKDFYKIFSSLFLNTKIKI